MDGGQDPESIAREGRLRAAGALTLVAVCVIGLGYLAWRALGRGGAASPGTPVAAVRFRDVQGRTFSLAQYRGRAVVVDVWATWCPPCRASLPEIARLQKATDGRYAVVAISVDSGGFADVLPYFAGNPGLGLTAVVPDGAGALEPLGRISGIPTTFVVDRQGKVAARWSGYYPGRAEAELKRVLGS
ncbi:MAG TPA: TlpA disulfide reductase family protein [Holophagaceae bacterium]|nr:TlpA disulfide reductase family protein [Holophagaceae bacterium]